MVGWSLPHPARREQTRPSIQWWPGSSCELALLPSDMSVIAAWWDDAEQDSWNEAYLWPGFLKKKAVTVRVKIRTLHLQETLDCPGLGHSWKNIVFSSPQSAEVHNQLVDILSDTFKGCWWYRKQIYKWPNGKEGVRINWELGVNRYTVWKIG